MRNDLFVHIISVLVVLTIVIIIYKIMEEKDDIRQRGNKNGRRG